MAAGSESAELTWWGAAGFRFTVGPRVFLIDPYLSRTAAARPVQALTQADITRADRIFLSHGHFDHSLDTPEIAGRTGAVVYCGRGVDGTLMRRGLAPARVVRVEEDGQRFEFDGYEAEAFFSRHVRFDGYLVARSVMRLKWRLFGLPSLLFGYPTGQVISWRLTVGGLAVHHFGTAGMTADELARLSARRTDVLLIPLQGHTRIGDIALAAVAALRPALVIPHHFDDFHPPMSETVDLSPFLDGVRRACPGTEVLVPTMNETIRL